MPRVFVLGATGYIGLALCKSLRRASHTVYGLARTASKATLLAQHEIIPLLGTVEGGEYLSSINALNIDVVVDCSGANMDGHKILSGLKTLGQERLTARGGRGPKLGFVYTSGTWVHGSSRTSRINDLTPVGLEGKGELGSPTPAPDLVAWRPALENAVLDARDVLDTLVVRPSLVYGGSSAIWGLWFGPLAAAAAEKRDSVALAADADAVPSLVHVEDAALALHCAVERVPVLAGTGSYAVFDASGSREPLGPILEAAARALGFEGKVVFEGPGEDKFAVAMNTSLRLESTRARDLLGWRPQRVGGMLDEIEVVVEAWKANQ